jgi:hypothetical protein
LAISIIFLSNFVRTIKKGCFLRKDKSLRPFY